MDTDTRTVLTMDGVTKSFSGVQVLSDGRLELASGEIHALMGANGAGKSTLMKILTGVYQRDDGEIRLAGADGELAPAALPNPKAAQRLGIAIVHQELIVMDDMTIAENISLGREPRSAGLIDDRAARQFAAEAMARVGLSLDARTRVGRLSPAEKQLIEISRAIAFDIRVLVLDEPTTSLSAGETARLHEVLRSLRDGGMALVYISHRMDEIFGLTDRITVMRDGAYVGSFVTAETDPDELVRTMIGRELSNWEQRAEAEQAQGDAGRITAPAVLEVEDVTNAALKGVSLRARPGEIVGLFGLMGAGRSELARALFGIDQRDGRVVVDGRELPSGRVPAALEAGLALAPEDRKIFGLVQELPLIRNMELARLRHTSVLRSARSMERSLWRTYQPRLGIRATGPRQVTRTLSGGNQQKVVLAKWLALEPRVLILDEPTKGIDVGAKRDIYELMQELAGKGMAVLMISSESEEIRLLSDRIVVMREGAVTFDGPNTGQDDETLLRYAMGVV